MIAYAFDAPAEIVLVTFILGLVGDFAEWLAHRKNNH
jgi:hypothetical protein